MINFCWHQWGKWVQTLTGELTSHGQRVGHFYYQERKCEKCGFVQRKEQQLY